jgi:hypothetical protein
LNSSSLDEATRRWAIAASVFWLSASSSLSLLFGSGGFYAFFVIVIILAFYGGPGGGSQGTILYGVGIDDDVGWLGLKGSELDVEGGGAQDAEEE